MNPRTIDFRYAPRSVWTCICRPDDPHKSLVREDGALLYDFRSLGLDVWRFERVYEFSIQTDQIPVRVTQSTESARVPIVTTQIEYRRASLTLQACGHQHGSLRTDIVLWTVAAAPGVDSFLTRFQMTCHAPYHYFAPATLAPSHRIYMAREEDRPEVDFWETVSTYLVEPPNAVPPGPLALVSTPQPLKIAHAHGYTSASGLATELFTVGGDQTVQGALFFPQNHDQVGEVSLGRAKAAFHEERRFWAGLPLQKITMQTPDPAVNDLLEACARNILQAREVEDGLPVFKVGPTVYRNLFVVDGHFFLEAAQYLGHADAAAAAVDTLLHRFQEDGSIGLIPDHYKETGIALATLVRQSELSGDWERLRREWPRVQRAVTYIRGLRRQAHELAGDDVAHGLMPHGYCDGGLGGKRPEFSTPLWTLVGLKDITRAAEALGFDDDAKIFRREFESLMEDFRRSAARAEQRTPEGIPFLPMRIPGGSGDHHWIPAYPQEIPLWHRVNPGTATWALAQAIYPGELFEPDDPLVQNFCTLLDRLDDSEGIPAATGWLPYMALWGYAASFYAHAWLYAGRPDKAADYLYAFANHASATRVWREEQSLRSTQQGQNFGDMPHNWASVEFIRLVRNLILFEHGSRLDLLAGLPEEWWDAPLRIEQMPTRYGKASVQVAPDDGGKITIRFDLNREKGGRVPGEVRLYLPKSVDAGRVLCNGQAQSVIDGQYIVLTGPDGATITLQRDVALAKRQ